MSGLNNAIVRNKIWSNDSIPFYILIIIMVLMPVYHWFLPPFIILWMLYGFSKIRSFSEGIRVMDSDHKTLTILFILFFIWQLTGMLYSDNPLEGWRNIELRISLVIFPLLMIMPGETIRKKSGLLLKVFAISTLTFLVLCYMYALYRSISIVDGIFVFRPNLPEYTWLNYFFSLEFAIFQHPSYLSVFTLLSAYISFENFFSKELPFNRRIYWLASSIILLVSIYFLSSRAAILSTIITLPIYMFIKLNQPEKRNIFWIVFASMVILFILVILTNPRMNNYMDWRAEHNVAHIPASSDRKIIWESVKDILGDNFILGVGTGDIQDELNKSYNSKGFKQLAAVNTNAHNQFLEILIENGIISLLLFLCMFFVMFYQALKKKSTLYLIYLIVVFISFLFETMLNRLAGVTFFSLFSFILILNEGRYQN